MARPLQKKKNRSSLPRVRQKQKSKKINIKSNPMVAANWDQSLTLTQNYQRLGLSSKLNFHTGGTEFKASTTISTTQTRNDRHKDALAIPSSRDAKTLGIEAVKVVRDPSTGAILRVEEEDGSGARKRKRDNPLNDPLNDLSESDTASLPDSEENTRSESRGIIKDLETAARFEKKKRPRMQSEAEREWCRRLVERWGDDWGGMGRDRRLNPMQQSEGDLRRRVGLWKMKREGGDGGEEVEI